MWIVSIIVGALMGATGGFFGSALFKDIAPDRRVTARSYAVFLVMALPIGVAMDYVDEAIIHYFGFNPWTFNLGVIVSYNVVFLWRILRKPKPPKKRKESISARDLFRKPVLSHS